GTITWAGEMESNASRVWTACLDEFDATPTPPDARDEPLNTGEKMQALFKSNGFINARGWIETLSYPIEADHLLALKANIGSDKMRFESLIAESREKCLASARRRMRPMGPDDFIFSGPVVYAVGS